jgi:tetratricopeptide (TPR) repeat protein
MAPELPAIFFNKAVRTQDATKIFVVIAFFILFPMNIYAKEPIDEGDIQLKYFLTLVQQNKPVVFVLEHIEEKNEILFCTGKSLAAKENNIAAALMLKGDFEEAKNRLEKVLPNSSLFLPFQYNLGLCYYHLNDRPRARLHLEKAQYLVPEYHLPYIQIGNIDSFEGKDDMAIQHYRDAFARNPKYLDALVLTGDIYFKRNQITAASKYYEAVLNISPRYSNALIGKGKILFYKEQFYKTYQLLLMVDLKSNYDKALHYYLAECAYKLQDYKTAYAQYTKLLEFKSDRFFITTSLKLIEHKQELSKRFTLQLDGE